MVTKNLPIKFKKQRCNGYQGPPHHPHPYFVLKLFNISSISHFSKKNFSLLFFFSFITQSPILLFKSFSLTWVLFHFFSSVLFSSFFFCLPNKVIPSNQNPAHIQLVYEVTMSNKLCCCVCFFLFSHLLLMAVVCSKNHGIVTVYLSKVLNFMSVLFRVPYN